MSLTPGNVTITSAFGDNAVTVLPGPIQVITVGGQGPQGPPGQSSLITGVCGVDIAAGTVVISSSGMIFPADPTMAADAPLVVGISIEAKLTGQMISIAQLGEVALEGLAQGARYFVGSGGALSTTPLAFGASWMRYIGTALSSNVLILISSVSILLY